MNNPRNVYMAAVLGPYGQPIGAYKIGVSYDHENRVKAQSAGLPISLALVTYVPGGTFMETLCHIYLRQHRIRGEYFIQNTETDAFVTSAALRGRAFYFISDAGVNFGFGDDSDRVRDAFLRFHDVSLSEVAAFLGKPVSAFDQPRAYARPAMAAASIIAQRREGGRYVSWPEDAMCGLLGQVHHCVGQKALPDYSEAA